MEEGESFTMKLAITFWGTQTYLNFLPEWYGRLEKYFIPGVEKHYFVFTDGELNDAPDNVTKMEIPHYGFPDTYNKTFEEVLEKNGYLVNDLTEILPKMVQDSVKSIAFARTFGKNG